MRFSFCSLPWFTILVKKPSAAEEMPFSSEGNGHKHEIPKQDPDTAVKGWEAGKTARSVLVTDGSSLRTTRAARQPCRNSEKSIELLMKAPQGAPHLFLG